MAIDEYGWEQAFYLLMKGGKPILRDASWAEYNLDRTRPDTDLLIAHPFDTIADAWQAWLDVTSGRRAIRDIEAELAAALASEGEGA